MVVGMVNVVEIVSGVPIVVRGASGVVIAAVVVGGGVVGQFTT